MTSDTNEKSGATIVHESEAQRQFIRLQLPVEVEIAQKRYISDDWSSGGLSLRWPEEELSAGGTLIREGVQFKARILFKFGLFDITIPVELEVRNVVTAKGRVGCRFVHQNAGQISLLQFIVNAYVTGEMVRVGDIIEIVSRDNTAPKRSIPAPTTTRSFRRFFNWLLVISASALLVGYIGLGLFERAFVVRSDAAVVLSEPLVVEAPASGRVYYQPIAPGTHVAEGTPLLMVQTPGGNMETVDSPCNCILRERLLDNHARIGTGDSLLRLMSADATPYIEAHLPASDALRVKTGDAVQVSLPGAGDVVAGRIASMEAGQSKTGDATLYIELAEKLAADYVGGPATVRVNSLRTRR